MTNRSPNDFWLLLFVAGLVAMGLLSVVQNWAGEFP